MNDLQKWLNLTSQPQYTQEFTGTGFRQIGQPQKPKGNQLLKTLFSIGGGTAGAILGTIAAPGFGTALGGALGSGAGTAIGRAAGGESVLGEGGLGEIGLDALLGGAFSGFGKAAKAAKLGGTALGVGAKEAAAQTAKGLGESAGVAAGKEAAQTLATKAGKITGEQALAAARQAAQVGRPTEVFGKAAQSLQRAAQKELGFQEAAKLGGQKISAQEGDTLYNFLIKDIGLKGTEKISPGKALRAVEKAQQSLIGSLEQSVKDSGYIFSKRDAEKLLANARKNYPLGTIKDSKALQTLENDVFNAIKDNTFEGVNKARQMLDRSIKFSRAPGSKTPWMEDVANSMRKSLDERLTQISGANKDIKGLYQRTTKARDLLQTAQGKEVAEIGSATQGAMRGLRAGQAMLGSSQGLQKTLQTLSGLNTAGGRIAAGMPTVLSQGVRQTARGAVAGAIGGQKQPEQADMTGMEQGGMEDMTGMMGGGTMGTGQDMGQQSQIDSYFQGLVLEDLQQTGGKRLSAIKAAYDIFGGGKSQKSVSQQNAERKLNQTINVVNVLQKQYQKAGGGQGWAGYATSLSGALKLPTQQAAAAKTFEDNRRGLAALISKSLGESGVLTDQDIKRALNNIPALTDDPMVAQSKWANLMDVLSGGSSYVGSDTRFNF